jgi:hypothetical protein
MSSRPRPPVDDDTPRVRPFLDWLREQSQGKTADELSEGLHTLIDKVRETEKKGSITLKVTVAYDSQARHARRHRQHHYRLPEHDRPTTIWYLDHDGNLTRNDPRQLAFEALREVPPPAGVDPKTGEIIEHRKAN